MAALRFNMGMLDDSLKLSRLAVELAVGESHYSALLAQAHHNLAVVYLAISDPNAALKHSRLATKVAPPPTNRFELTEHVLMEDTMVKALIELGRSDHARSHVDRAVSLAVQAETPRAYVQAQLALARWEAATGTADVALTRLSSVEAKLRPTDPAFRDFIEVEHLANQRAGRSYSAQYYNRKYLSSLAEFQRKGAIEQVTAVKRLLKRAESTEPTSRSIRGYTARDVLVEIFAQRVEALAALAEMREDSTGEHLYRVGRLSRKLAIAIGYTEECADMVEQAARLHDIGKLAIPDVILLKRGKLSSTEHEIVRRHANEGCQILVDLLYSVESTDLRQTSRIGEGLRLAAEVAQYHHEWWNGSGYPRGISGVMIPEVARIVALADVFDELMHSRPYKRPLSKTESLKRVESMADKQFDPRLCSLFISIAKDFEEQSPRGETAVSPFAAANRVIQRIVSVAA
jgi:putative two-component system response regulator